MDEHKTPEQKYQHIIIVVLVVLLMIISLVVAYFVLTPVVSRFSADFYFPVFKLVNSAERSIAEKSLQSKSKAELAAAVVMLQRQNDELTAEVASLKQFRADYADLRQTARMQPPEGYNYIIADVLLRNTSSWLQSFTIDKGTNDGIHTGDLVIASVVKKDELYSAAIGRIETVSNHSATVQTIYHPDCAIGAYLKGADAYGLLNGMQRSGQAQDGATISVTGLSAEKQYKPGDVFLTSHFSKSFPADIELGTLVSSYVDADGLCRTAELLPSVNFANIRSVAVLSRKE